MLVFGFQFYSVILNAEKFGEQDRIIALMMWSKSNLFLCALQTSSFESSSPEMHLDNKLQKANINVVY